MTRISIALSAATLFACSGSPATPSTPAAATTASAASAPAPAGPNPYAVGGEHAGCAEAKAGQGEHACAEAAQKAGGGHDCGAVMGEPIKFPDTAVVTDASGAKVTVAGAKLTGAPLVSVADLLAHPDTYVGKTVRLEGNVSAMCGHMRAWFAVQAPGRSADFVRVFSAPAFLVPENAVGTKARTEGVVEVIATSPDTARHLAGEHELAQGAQQKTVVIRATGAEFI